MRQSTIEKVETMLRRECKAAGKFYCSNRAGAKLSGVVKESFKRAVDHLAKNKGLQAKRVSYFDTEYYFRETK